MGGWGRLFLSHFLHQKNSYWTYIEKELKIIQI